MYLNAALEAAGQNDLSQIHYSAQQGVPVNASVSLPSVVFAFAKTGSQICVTSLLSALACLCDRSRSISAGGVLLLAVFKPALFYPLISLHALPLSRR